jgi:hypothetical protein
MITASDIKSVVGESAGISEKEVEQMCKRHGDDKRDALKLNEFEDMMKKDITVK